MNLSNTTKKLDVKAKDYVPKRKFVILKMKIKIKMKK
jgi:hypothetical protein